jgi:hypothetical protein
VSEPPSTLGILDRVLAFMDKPWKAIAILLFVVVGGIGWFLYEQRARIADMVLHEPIMKPQLSVATFARGYEKLLRETKGDLAVLIEINLNDNVAFDRIGYTASGTPWVPVEGPQPALHPQTSMDKVIRFLRNDVVCVDTQNGPSADMQALFAANYLRACMVAVPPILGTSVGGLVVAWKTPLPPPVEQRAGLAMTAAAMSFATW